MSRPVLYVAVTNHGFGHVTRTAAVVAEIQRRCPEILPVMVTTAPRWLLDSYLEGEFLHRPRAFDVGVVQPDSLTMDLPATLAKLKEIRDRASSIIASEVNFIRQNRVGLVLGDIPPLAAPIARAAGVPCWMASNFGWDYIYRAWGGEFVEIADWIGECFAQCDRLFRMPFHEPMSAFPVVQDVGLTGGSPRYDPDDLRSKFNLTAPKEKTVLLTFGGLGLAEIPYHNLTRFPDWQFITTDQQAPDFPNVFKVGNTAFRPVDFMPLCGRVVSKPGFGTFSEACRLDVPIVSLTRNDFAESALLLAGIRHHCYHRIITPAEFIEGDWDFLHRPLNPPETDQPLDKTGNEAIAQAVVDYFAALEAG